MQLSKKQGEKLLENIVTNEHQWRSSEADETASVNFLEEDAQKGVQYVLSNELKKEFDETMKVNGIPSEELKGKEVETFQIYEREDEIYKAFHSFRYQQNKINGELINYVKHHEKIIEQMSEELEDMGHTARQLDKHARMISTQCEQIAKTQSLILEQECPTNSVSANVVTRSNKVTQGPKGQTGTRRSKHRKDKMKKK